MSTIAITIGIYSILILAGSLCGGWLPLLVKLTHRRMQLVISLVAGLMLGVGVFHMIPHGISELNEMDLPSPIDQGMHWLMIGLVFMFFLLRAFHFHQHGPAETFNQEGHVSGQSHDHGHDHSHDHAHDHAHDHDHDHGSAHHLSWVGIAFGLSLHTLIDGLALAASVKVDIAHGHYSFIPGFGIFLAILLHKPLDAISITSIMSAGGWSKTAKHLVNVGFSLMCPLGACIFLFGVEHFSQSQHLIVGNALMFSAGVFICISLGDLLPEIQFHSHDRIKLSINLLLGVALAYGIGFLEPEHSHGRKKDSHSHDHGEHDHEDHDHGHKHGENGNDEHDHNHEDHDHKHE
jgi:zinc and cadmium transporter